MYFPLLFSKGRREGETVTINLMRTTSLISDTVVDQLQQLRRSPNFHAATEKALLGQVVITRIDINLGCWGGLVWNKLVFSETNLVIFFCLYL